MKCCLSNGESNLTYFYIFYLINQGNYLHLDKLLSLQRVISWHNSKRIPFIGCCV